MKDMGIRQGSVQWAQPIIVNHDTVYVHTDIQQLENHLYQYHEIQYDIKEYIAIIGMENYNLKQQLSNIEQKP